MEFSLDTLIAILGLFIGGGGGAFFTWRWQRAKAKAEAESAEATAAKEMQDMYQQLIQDVKSDRADQRTYIDELKADRNHYKEERNMMRDRLDKMDDSIRNLQREVDAMRPFVCTIPNCPKRQRAATSAGAGAKKGKDPEITPYGDKNKTHRPQE